MNEKLCILYDNKICDNCGECNMCDLDPKKVCDSCGACLEMDDEYKTLDVDLVYEDHDTPETLSFEELFPDQAFGGDFSEDEDSEEDEGYDDFEEDDFDTLRDDFGELF